MPRDAVSLANAPEADQYGDGVALYCLACGSLVARGEHAIRMNGDHEHVVFNPAGVVFRVVCFKEAPGVAPVGPPSALFTWFRGYTWRLVHCRGCGRHLGWLYEGAGPPAVFFGLVRPLLTENRIRE